MKIEIGESLMYSWLRHIKGCQLVQTNWKKSPTWTPGNTWRLYTLISNQYSKQIKISNVSQVLKQAECDVIGADFSSGAPKLYSIEIAFHEGGLNYGKGSSGGTVSKVLNKFISTSLCLLDSFGISDAEIIFASPKIGPKVMSSLNAEVPKLESFVNSNGYHFTYRVIANNDFRITFLDPLLTILNSIQDTSELFMRAATLLHMFYDCHPNAKYSKATSKQGSHKLSDFSQTYKEFKIGQIANIILRDCIADEKRVTSTEIDDLQDKVLSKKLFGVNYPVLVSTESSFDDKRYYREPIYFKGKDYYLCSQWYEHQSRTLLINWLENHQLH